MLKLALSLLLLAPALSAQTFEECKKDFAAGRFPQALEKAGAVAERDDDYAKARYLVGEIQLLLGDRAAATAAFREALKAKPDSAPILTALGRALVESDENEEAVNVLTKAVAKDPKSGRAHCFLGIAQRQESFGKKGAKEIAKGVSLAPDDAVVARAAVLYWVEEDDLAKARKVADEFRKKNRKSPMGEFLRALVLEREKKYDDAIEAYRKAIAIDDKFLDAHKNLAILCIAQNPMYRDKKRTETAMKHLERYRELGGKDPQILQIHETLKKVLPQITGGK